MTRDLRTATLLSIGLHGALIWPGSLGRQASVDVQRGPVSSEVELWVEPQLAEPATSTATPAAPEDDEPREDERSPAEDPRPPVEAAAGDGALSEAKPEGFTNPPPVYPWLARLRGWQGVVVLRVRVEADGSAGDVRILEASGCPTLDAAAREAIRRWRFVPATRLGRAVSSELELPVRFRLTEER